MFEGMLKIWHRFQFHLFNCNKSSYLAIAREVYSTHVGQERVPEIDGCYEVIKRTGQFDSMKVKYKRQNAGMINSKP